MGQEPTRLPCPECGVPGEPDPEGSRWPCDNCGNAFFLRRCKACTRVSYVDGLQGFHTPWPCTWCGQFNTGFSQNRDPAAATVTEVAAQVARFGLPGQMAGGGDRGSAAVPVPGCPDHGDRDAAGRGQRSAAGIAGPGAAPPLPRQVMAARRSGRPRLRRVALLAVLAAACVAAAFVVLAAGGPPRAAGVATRQGGGQDSATTRPVEVSVGRIGGIDFQGVAGQLTIIGTRSSRVALTGQLRGTGGVPDIETRREGAGDVLMLSVQCAPGSLCTENLRLAVPAGTPAAVRQPSGQILVTGLSGPLSITAANVDISARGLRSPYLAAMITNGHLSAGFAAAPRRVLITLVSAQATLRVPPHGAYRITQQVTSGYVNVAIPQAASATHTVTARIDSGELELLPS
jgi:hypothetical protein